MIYFNLVVYNNINYYISNNIIADFYAKTETNIQCIH